MDAHKICILLLGCFVLSASAFPMDTKLRREKRGTITSALMGAAGGALLGHLAKGISPSFDAKKGAMLGAALGGGYGYYSSRTRTTTAFPDYGINSQ